MIFSWFSQIQRTNEDRRDSGFSHLSPESSIAVNDAKWKACHVNRVMSFRVPIPQTPTFQTQNTKTGKSSTILRKRVQNAARLFSLALSLCVDISVVSPVHSANERRSRLLFMRQWSQVGHSKRHAISREELESWAQSLDNLLASQSQFSLAHNTSWLSPFLNRVHRWTSLPAASINRSRSKSRHGYKWPRLQSLSCWNLLSCFA